jgi:hypothetical protein
LLCEPLCRVPQDINVGPSMKSAPADSKSPKVDKPPSPQAERIAPDSLKPSSPKGAHGSPGAGNALTCPTHGSPNLDPTSTPSVQKPSESPRASPPSPRSRGLGAAGGSQRGEGSSAPQPEEVLRQRSWVTESLWDNPDFIQARFHINQFVTIAIDTEADREKIKALYSNLKTTSDWINVSA